MGFIDAQREHFGVESICKALQVAPSGYWRRAARRSNPALLPARAKSDAELTPQIERVWTSNLQVYGYRKVWRQMLREGTAVARCTVERLMRLKGLQGARRGKKVRTTVPDARKSKDAVELATLEWVSWFNHHRLMDPLGYIPPAQAEANYHRQIAGQAMSV